MTATLNREPIPPENLTAEPLDPWRPRVTTGRYSRATRHDLDVAVRVWGEATARADNLVVPGEQQAVVGVPVS
jgi:hypothetical protein